MNEIKGYPKADQVQLAIVTARFNQIITAKLQEGARECFLHHGGKDQNLTSIWVPGAFEITQAVQACLKSKKYHAIVALGAVIRGETPHFDFICDSVTAGITSLSLKYAIPITFGVLTVDNLQQAQDRTGLKGSNKGWDSTLAALDMVSVLDQIS